MAATVLIVGGWGRIGQAVAQDLLRYTDAHLRLSCRTPPRVSRGELGPPGTEAQSDRLFLPPWQVQNWQARIATIPLDLAQPGWAAEIAAVDLVIHCAGPFRRRDLAVLQACIAAGVDYLDVSDSPDYVRAALGLGEAAAAAGITAIVSTGVFPGLSNSMARLAVEQLEKVTQLQLNYVVAGSGGAGPTVMRTTFLELQTPFATWIDRQWQPMLPYREAERVRFLPPYGEASVYGFSTSEAATLPLSFACDRVLTKFGSLPPMYNHLTRLMTWGPLGSLLQRPLVVEGLAQISYAMTQVSDRFTGVGLAMQAIAQGQAPGQTNGAEATYQVDFVHGHTAIAAGQGTGSIAADLLAGRLHRPGVWPVEQAVPTSLFLAALAQRGLRLVQGWR